jgi:hypothetical protein
MTEPGRSVAVILVGCDVLRGKNVFSLGKPPPKGIRFQHGFSNPANAITIDAGAHSKLSHCLLSEACAKRRAVKDSSVSTVQRGLSVQVGTSEDCAS